MDRAYDVERVTRGRCAVSVFSLDNGSVSADFVSLAIGQVGV